jgi:hypothetical protein
LSLELVDHDQGGFRLSRTTNNVAAAANDDLSAGFFQRRDQHHMVEFVADAGMDLISGLVIAFGSLTKGSGFRCHLVDTGPVLITIGIAFGLGGSLKTAGAVDEICGSLASSGCLAVGSAAGMAIAYFLAAQLGLALRAQPADVAVFWPASGLAAGILIVTGRRVYPALLIGVVVGTVAANILNDTSLWTSALKGLCNAGEAVVVAWLLEKWFGPSLRLGTSVGSSAFWPPPPWWSQRLPLAVPQQ